MTVVPHGERRSKFSLHNDIVVSVQYQEADLSYVDEIRDFAGSGQHNLGSGRPIGVEVKVDGDIFLVFANAEKGLNIRLVEVFPSGVLTFGDTNWRNIAT